MTTTILLVYVIMTMFLTKVISPTTKLDHTSKKIDDINCRATKLGETYAGHVSTSANGFMCQHWIVMANQSDSDLKNEDFQMDQ